jgi:hypothetical protein
MYNLTPRNRYLLVEENIGSITEVQESRGFLLPEDYKPRKEASHKVMKVVKDATGQYSPKTLVLVPTNMLEEIDINNQQFYLVTDNYIVATVTN